MASAGISALGKYHAHKANKPIKGRAFKQRANTGYLRKYMADLQGRSADRARTELAMRPALRMIGAQQRQGQRQLAYQAAQQGLEGSGIEAQKQLSLQKGTTEATSRLGESVLNQELARARQMHSAREGQRMKVAGEIGQREGAVSEANRLAQFNVNEQYRQAVQQHNRQSKAIGIQGATDVIGAGVGVGIGDMKLGMQADEIIKAMEASPELALKITNLENQTDEHGNLVSMENYADAVNKAGGGKVTKGYYNGGTIEDLSTAIPSINVDIEKKKKQYQTEYDTKLADYEKRKKAVETANIEGQKQFDIDQEAEKKRIEEANLLNLQQFEEDESKRKEKIDLSNLATFEQYRKDQIEDKQKLDALNLEREKEYKEDLEDYTQSEEERKNILSQRVTSPEYKLWEKRESLLNQFGVTEKGYNKAQQDYNKITEEQTAINKKKQDLNIQLQEVTDLGKRQQIEQKLAELEDQTEEIGTLDQYLKANEDKYALKPSKKKRILKRFKKHKERIEGTGTKKLVPGEEPIKPEVEEFTPGEAPELEKFTPGKAPKEDQFVEGEFKPQEFTEAAPVMQEISDKELYKIRKKAIKSQLRAGIDVMGNIQKTTQNRIASEFYQDMPTMTTAQMYAHPYGVQNPAKVAQLISTRQKTAQAAQKKQEKVLADQKTNRDLIQTTLLDMGQITAQRREDLAHTTDDESRLGDTEYGEKIRQIVVDNPSGVNPEQFRQLLGYVDQIRSGEGEDPLFGDIGDIDNMSNPELLEMTAGFFKDAIDPTRKSAKLLKAILKLPRIETSGTLAEALNKNQNQDQNKQSGGFTFK